jgi:hypothetical protein
MHLAPRTGGRILETRTRESVLLPVAAVVPLMQYHQYQR